MKKLYLLMMLVTGVLLASCGKKSINREVEYLPFQESEGGNWGMISTDGEVLFSEEFQNRPTFAVNGRFMVKNEDNLWEIYTTDKKPEKIGGEYLSASLFYEDVTPVVAKGERIQFIDRDGNVKVTLDKIDGKTVTTCSSFVDGLAVVKAGDFWGAVDTNGEMVLEPKYCYLRLQGDGSFIAVDKKYAEESDREKVVFKILSRSGKELGTIKGSKFEDFVSCYTSYRRTDNIVNEGILLQTKNNGNRAIGIMNFDGEWKVKPMPKVKGLNTFLGNRFIFATEDGFGLMDENCEQLVRAKFDYLQLLDDDILMGRKSKEDGYALYDLEGERVSKDEYELIDLFYDGEHAFARIGKHDYVLINKQGEEQKLKVDIYDMGYNNGDFEMTSDYFDMDEVVSLLRIKKDGFLGLNTNMTGLEAVKTINGMKLQFSPLSENAKDYSGDGDSYGLWSDMTASIYLDKANVMLDVNTKGLIATERTGSGWFTYTQKVWSDNPVQAFKIFIGANDCTNCDNSQIYGKMKTFYGKMLDEVKKTGNVVKKGKNSVVVDAGNGCYYCVNWAGSRVDLFYGKFNPESFNVDAYDDAKEDYPTSLEFPCLVDEEMQVPIVEEYDDDDWGELESPPADDL